MNLGSINIWKHQLWSPQIWALRTGIRWRLGQQTLDWFDQLRLRTAEAKRVINAPNFHLFLLFETRGAFVVKPAIPSSDIAYSTSCSFRYIRAVHSQQHHRRWNMHIHAWARLRIHNKVWGFSQVRTNVLLPDQHRQLWWEWTRLLSGRLAEYAKKIKNNGANLQRNGHKLQRHKILVVGDLYGRSSAGPHWACCHCSGPRSVSTAAFPLYVQERDEERWIVSSTFSN